MLLPPGPIVFAGTSEGSPHAFTTLPSCANSITGGDAFDLNPPPSAPVAGSAPPMPSGDVRPPFWNARVTTKTWSWESTQVPPTSPVIQLFGNGLGHVASTTNVGGTSA